MLKKSLQDDHDLITLCPLIFLQIYAIFIWITSLGVTHYKHYAVGHAAGDQLRNA